MNKLKWVLATAASLVLLWVAFTATVEALRAIFPAKLPVQIMIEIK